MQHERSWRVRTGRELQGRIDLVLTQQRIAVMNDKPVVARVKQRSFDTPENRLTSLALVAAEGLLERDQIEELRFVRRRWPCSPPTIKQALEDVEVVQRRMLNNHYRGVRAYYRELVGLSQIVLNISGFGNGQDHSLSGRSFLVNTAQVFEAFVLRAVMETFSGLDVIVTKGGSDVRSLYTDGSFGLNPDVVIERDGRCVAVLDAKYKAPTSNDHYQMMSYIENFGVKGGALIRPTYAKEIPGVKKFKTSTGKSVDVVSVDLTNLEDAVTDIHNFVRSFV
jgi:5-methylcytosine-specific restriction endonuclease McrBC regulatory subunit McrC